MTKRKKFIVIVNKTKQFCIVGCVHCTRRFPWFEDSQDFEGKNSSKCKMLQIDKKFCRKCFKEFCFTHRFLFPNVSFV